MSRHLCLLCGLLLQGCCLFGAADGSIAVTEAGSAQVDATRAEQPPSLRAGLPRESRLQPLDEATLVAQSPGTTAIRVP
jgi:hypothetical protein